MYIPPANAEQRLDVLHAFIRAHPLATLVTVSDAGLFASHLPVLLDPARGPYGTIEGHIARANPHHRLATAMEGLLVFLGPDAYVSPSWYAAKQEHGRVVPTWNYIAVHAYGAVRFRDDEAFLRSQVARLTAHHEARREHPWAVADAPASYIDAQLRAIVGVEVEISRLEGKWKMSQNRSEADIDGVIEGLSASGEPAHIAVAEVVEQVRPSRHKPGQ